MEKQNRSEEQLSNQIKLINAQIQADYQNSSLYEKKSQIYEEEGEIDLSLLEISKALYLGPNAYGYLKRGQLFASRKMFVSAIEDYENAAKTFQSQRYEMEDEQKNKKIQCLEEVSQRETVEKFITQELCMNNLQPLKQAADVYEKTQKFMVAQDSDKYSRLMAELLKANARLENRFEQYERNVQIRLQHQQLEQLKLKQLLELKDKQIRHLKDTIKEQSENIQKIKDYQSIFYEEMENSSVSLNNKEKFIAYFRNIVSDMEKYYLAAKVLGDFDDGTKIRFEDYGETDLQLKDGLAMTAKVLESKSQKKKSLLSKQLVEKIFKIFDKNSKSLDKVSDVVKQLPYLGTAFKILKSLVKGFGWFNKIKQDNECENILQVRSNITSFNQLTTCIAYRLYKNYKVKIAMVGIEEYHKNVWERMTKKYLDFKKKLRNTYANIPDEQLLKVKQIASLHAAIIMVGIAYRIIVFPASQNPSEEQFQEIFNIIDSLEQKINKQKQPQTGGLSIMSIHDSQLNQGFREAIEQEINCKKTDEKGKCTIY